MRKNQLLPLLALLAAHIAEAQVTTGPSVTGVAASQASVAITGGSIDGTAIGATTPSSGAFTTLSATTAIPVTSGGTGVTTSTGSGSVVRSASPTLTGTPLLGSSAGIGTLNACCLLYTSGSGSLSGTTQVGVLGGLTGLTTGTSILAGIYGQPISAASSYTVTNAASIYGAAVVLGAGSTITTASSLYAADQTVGATNVGVLSAVSSGSAKWNIYASGSASNAFAGSVRIGSTVAPAVALDVTGAISASTQYNMNGTLLNSATAPTISSGFGSSPSIASNNGSATFRVNVGTGGTASTGVIGLPTAANGWNCAVQEFAPNSTALLSVTVVSASSTSSVTVVNDLLSTGAATAWQASQVLILNCAAY